MTNYNRILTDTDRVQYMSVLNRMYAVLPMSGYKIADAMVQEAYVYQTARDFITMPYPRILAAGSFHDVAAELLRYDGYAVYDVDPVLNYDLHTYVTIETPHINNRFDCIVSTSVLEHTVDDEQFVDDCSALLVPWGYGIFTCDFKDDWLQDQPVPYTSNRFYTTNDLTQRLVTLLEDNNCALVDTPDYSARDRFIWDGINYSFAAWVFKKNL